MKKNSLKISSAILIISAVSMITSSISIILGGISESFPNRSVEAIQLLYSIISGAGIIGSILAGKLAGVTTKRVNIIIFSVVILLGAALAYFFNASYYALLAASIIIGIGTSTLRPLSIALIAEHFDGIERAKMTGIQSLAVNVGGALIALAVGVLSTHHWKNAYLIFLLMLPVLLTAMFMLPKGIVEKNETAAKVKVMTPQLAKLVVEAFVFGMGMITFLANIALASAELGAEYVKFAGYANSIYMIAAIIVGLLLTNIMKIFKQYTMTVGILLAAAGLLCLGFTTSPALIILCSILFGFGFGVYFPAAYATIPGMVAPSTITMAISIFSIGMSVGCMLTPYIITSGAALINGSINTRFLLAAVIMVVTVVVAALTNKKGAENQ